MGWLVPAAVGGIAGEAAGAVEEGEGAVGVIVDAHLGADVVRPDRARRNLQAPAVVTDRVVVAHLTLLLNAQDVGEDRRIDGDEGGPRLLGGNREAGVVRRQINLRRKRLAASTQVIPASASSFGSRSCSVRKARSQRPRASGEEAAMCSMPSWASARPTWVLALGSGFSPAFGVRK